MEKVIISPSKYIQGANVLKNLSKYMTHLGKSTLAVCDDFVMKLVKSDIDHSYQGGSAKITFEKFNGECSRKEIDRIIAVAKDKKVDSIVGIGGGKTLDTAKAVSFYSKLALVIAPTIASTDAPCSALCVIYTPEGVFSEYLLIPKNPDLVLVDTQIIASAPVRLLVAGMGDALSTYFEARACFRSFAKPMSGGFQTKSALALAKLCYETLLESGYSAKLSAENKVVTKSLEDIIEANTYLSGIGFESGGLAAAHAVHNGLTTFPELHPIYHGEKVAFGTITHLVLENAEKKEIEEVISFCKKVGLPTCFADMGMKKIDHDRLKKAAEVTCAKGETIHNMPFEVSPEDVYAAMLTADKLGSTTTA